MQLSGNEQLEISELVTWAIHREDTPVEIRTALSEWSDKVTSRRRSHGKITLRQARLNAGLSVAEVAAASGIPGWTIASWEKDCRDTWVDELIKVTEVLRISMGHIYIGAESEYMPS